MMNDGGSIALEWRKYCIGIVISFLGTSPVISACSLSLPSMHARTLSLSVYILYSMNDIHHLKLK